MKVGQNNIRNFIKITCLLHFFFFSSPGRSPGKAIVLPPASALALAFVSALALAAALAKSLTLSFLCDGQGAVRRAILSL